MEVGHTIAEGRYRLLCILGEGGMGIVYEAQDAVRGQRVALKTLRGMDPEALYLFKREFRSLAGISHEHLVPLYDLVADGPHWFFTMELVEGSDFLSYVRPAEEPFSVQTATLSNQTQALTVLSSRADAPTKSTERLKGQQQNAPVAQQRTADGMPRPGTRTGGGHLDPRWGAEGVNPDPSRLWSALEQLVVTVNDLHREGKLHCDLKPSNVLVRSDHRVVICDFGLVTESVSPDPANVTMGTLAYASPEQLTGGTLTEASDWYSVGAMIYKSLIGITPFQGLAPVEAYECKLTTLPPEPKEIFPDVDRTLNDLSMRLLAADPSRRPTFDDVLRALGHTASSHVPSALGTAQADEAVLGRQQQLETLSRALSHCREGEPGMVYVRGLSGMGKTSLVERFITTLEGDDVLVLQGRCHERESVPYKAIDAVLDALTRHILTLESEDIDALRVPDVALLARLFPVLQRIPALADPPGHAAHADVRNIRRRGFRALREMLKRLSENTAVVMFVDDLQWGDRDSAVLLSELLKPPDNPKLLFIGAFRQEEVDSSEFLQEFLKSGNNLLKDIVSHDVSVDVLSDPHARQLVERVSHGTLSRDRTERIVHEAGGSPFFLHELIRYSLQEETDLDSEKDLSLDAVIRARTALLGPAATQLLRVLAVAGGPIPQRIAQRAAGLTTEWENAMTAVKAARMARTGGVGAEQPIETFHDRIRETVAGSLSPDERRGWHQVIAEALEHEAVEDPGLLFEHFRAAGDEAGAARYVLRAADQAAAVLAFERAARLYQEALDILRPEGQRARTLRIQRADALASAGLGKPAADAYLSALEDADDDEALDLRRKAAEQLLNNGHVNEGVDVLTEVMETEGLSMPATQQRAARAVRLMRHLLKLRGLDFEPRSAEQIPSGLLRTIDTCWAISTGLHQVDYPRSHYFQLLHLLYSLQAGDRARIALGLAIEASTLAYPAGPLRERSKIYSQKALELAREAGDAHAMGVTHYGLGLAQMIQGLWSSARRNANEAMRLFRQHCSRVSWELAQTEFALNFCLSYQGAFPELTQRVKEQQIDADERGDLFTAHRLRTHRVHNIIWLVADTPEEALRQIRIAHDQWKREDFPVQKYFEINSSTYADIYRGRGDLAWERIRDAWPWLKKQGVWTLQMMRLDLYFVKGRAALAAFQQHRADPGLLEEARTCAEVIAEEAMPWSIGQGKSLESGIAWMRGDKDGALHRLEEAFECFSAAEMHFYTEACRRKIGQLVGGEDGRERIAQSDAWMTEHIVRNPEAMSSVVVPSLI